MAKNLRTWVNIELEKVEADELKEFLVENDIEFESSQCFDLIHIETNVNEFEKESIEEWIKENIQ